MSQAIYAHPSWIEIDLQQFKKNISIIKNYIGKRLFCLPVKANAYGHGLTTMSKSAEDAGVDYLAVAHLQEGIRLRLSGIKIPILVLGAIHEDQILDLINFDLEFTISSKFKADLVATKCLQIQRKCKIHLEVDTGMQRTGVRCSSVEVLFKHVKSLPCFDVIGIYSHFATADQAADLHAVQQITAFTDLLQSPIFFNQTLIRHMANSGGISFYPSSNLDMVRPSLLTFGYATKPLSPPLSEIKPCFTLKAKVSYFKVVPQGAGISYGHSHITSKQTRIVTIPVGYGDGYRRCLSNKGQVLIHGKRFPIVGVICMDQFMVDIGDEEVHVGDEVVLIGKQGTSEISLLEIANLCDTIPYEILCLFNERIPRIY